MTNPTSPDHEPKPEPATAQTKRLVVLTKAGLEHRYVINRLAQAATIHTVIVDEHVRSPNLKRARSHGMGNFLSRLALRGFNRMIKDDQARTAAMERVLGHQATAEFQLPADTAVHRVDGINTEATRSLLRQAKADLIVVYGTGIVRDHILGCAADLAMNMHTGISPYYRGTHCAFWPIVNGEPQFVGATVHECTSAVDGGRVFATGQASLSPDDTLHAVFARAVQAGAELYADQINAYLSGQLEGQAQDLSVGREYRGYMRTLGAELKARRNLRSILRRDLAGQ